VALLFVHRQSLVPGVTWSSLVRRWVARGTVGGTRKSLGSFQDRADAEFAVSAFNASLGRPPQQWTSQCLLDELDPDLNGDVMIPLEAKSAKLLWWSCTEGHPSWRTAVHHRTAGQGCPVCAGKVLTEQRIATVLRGRNIKQVSPIVRSQESSQWLCLDCGVVFEMRWNDIQQGHGCSNCCPGGFSHSRPGYVYLIEFPETALLPGIKVGITHRPTDRLVNHVIQGSARDFLRVAGPMPGGLAHRVEATIVGQWRAAGYIQCDDVLDGSSETALGLDSDVAVRYLADVLACISVTFKSQSIPLVVPTGI